MNILAFSAILFFATIDATPISNSSLENLIQTRVYNGKPAKRKDFKYQARLLILDNNFQPQVTADCGGALISDRHVLTAAHCLYNCHTDECLNYIIVVLGDVDRTNQNDKNRKVFQVERSKVIIHKGYRLKRYDNDIAIVPLPEKVEFNDYIKPAELPSQQQGSLLGKTVYVAGWGLDGEKNTNFLLYTKLTVLAQNKCNMFKSFAPTMQLCVKNEIKRAGTCQGDSGSPYVIRGTKGLLRKTTYTVVGISSYGDIDCKRDLPEIMTNVKYYLQWIHDNTGIEIPK